MPIVKRPVIHILVIMVFALLSYSNTFDVPFMLDDYGNIVVNPDVSGLSNLFTSFTLDHITGTKLSSDLLLKFRSIGYLSFALNYAVHGLDVWGYHLVNILIHLGVSLLCYGLVILTFKTPGFRKIGEDPSSLIDSRNFIALFSALLFAVHPVQTQAVTYVVQRFASLATLFWMLSLVSYIQFRFLSDQASVVFKRSALYAFSLISAVLAMKSKEFALLLPIVIALYEFMFLEGKLKARLAYLTPICLTMAIVPLTVMFSAKRGLLESHEKLLGSLISREDYLLTQFRVIVTYIRLLLFPVNQIFDYDYPVYHSFFNPEVLISFLFLLSILLMGVYFYYRSRSTKSRNSHLYRLAAFGIFWFFITNSVESSIISLPDVIFEHRLYLPSIGFFLTIVSGLELLRAQWGERASYALKISVCAMLLLTTGLSAAAYSRNNVWRDKVGLMEDDVKKSPGKARPRCCLGNMYGGQGRIEEAMYQFKTVTVNTPGYADAHYYLGMTYGRLGRLEEAVEEYKKSNAIRFDNADAHADLGVIYARLGRWDEAVREYTTTIMLSPQSEAAHNNLGNAYRNLGRMEEALSEYRTALRIKPDFAEAHYNLGSTYSSLGRMEEARNEYQAALRIKPDFIEARRKLEKQP